MQNAAQFFESLFLFSYFLVLGLLCIYGLHRYYLVYLFHKYKSRLPQSNTVLHEYPTVTIQIPIFNERYVVERILEAVRQLEYPREHLEIQVLDDSTDDTPQIVHLLVEQMRRDGFDIDHIRRTERTGYKAGALAAGLEKAKGEYVAIFDADFCPPPKFLVQTLPYFNSEKIGMVQTRWGYLNRDYSLLTRLQAMYLDAHFIIEHLSRNRSGRFFNFNGTAGIWRKTCLISAGGWQSDTLTEDLDISYRAQLKGWQFVFLPDVVSPSELPVEMTSFKLQQHRWAKGSIQTAKKLLVNILTSANSRKIKLEAFFHLSNNIAYVLMVYLSLTMLPSMMIRSQLGWQTMVWFELPILVLATPSVAVFYFTAQHARNKTGYRTLLYAPMLMALGIGMALSNGKAVLEALFGIDSEFKRTPKHGIQDNKSSWINKKYSVQMDLITMAEISMSVYFMINIYFAWQYELYVVIPFLLLFLTGFTYVSLVTLWQSAGKRYRRWWRSESALDNAS